MSRLKVAVIVEGDGEVAAVPILLRRIWYELLGGEYIDVLTPPIRRHRDRLIANKDDELFRSLKFAANKLRDAHTPDTAELILILVDADESAACQLGPRLQQLANEYRPDKDIACVLANPEYETWFVAAAESLAEYLNLAAGDPPDAPEQLHAKKKWIEQRFKGVKYQETVDQPKMSAKIDLIKCRERSPSFDKLCRELARRCRPNLVGQKD